MKKKTEITNNTQTTILCRRFVQRILILELEPFRRNRSIAPDTKQIYDIVEHQLINIRKTTKTTSNSIERNRKKAKQLDNIPQIHLIYKQHLRRFGVCVCVLVSVNRLFPSNRSCYS